MQDKMEPSSALTTLGVLVGLMTAFSVLVWGASEAIGHAFGIKKIGVALVLGSVGGTILAGVGLFDVPGVEKPMWEMAFGALLGLLCGVGASKVVNDQIVNRITGRD